MAQGIVLTYEGEETRFALARIDRDKLYGQKTRLAVDEQGQTCTPAWLTSDGAAVVPPGGVALLYVDERFASVERADLQAVDAAGQPLPGKPSTLGVTQPLAGPVPPQRLLDHVVDTVYQLNAETIGADLQQRLAAGEIFEFRFNWREDHTDSPAFLLANEHGNFALICSPTNFAFMAREAAVADDLGAVDGDGDEELDFSMI